MSIYFTKSYKKNELCLKAMMLGLKLSECLKILKEITPLTLFTYTHSLIESLFFFRFIITAVCFQNTLNVNLVMEIKCLFHINLCTLYVL